MKTNFTIFKAIALSAVYFLTLSEADAQCIAPVMTYANPVLISGTAGQINSKYKFTSVTPGVDAIITIKGIVGGATLTSIDDNTYGYSAAWQPVVMTKTTLGTGESYVSFSIDFVETSNNNNSHLYNCFALSFIDIDGDNDKVREFIETQNFDSYQTNASTLLQMTQNSGFTRALGPVLNYPGLDTSAYPTNIVFKFTNKTQVQEVHIGSQVENGFTPQDRYNLGYFLPLTFPSSPLPVKYSSFDAVANENIVTLNWITENEINNHHFEVERSFDGTNFKTIGVVLDGFAAGVSSKAYQLKDNSAELKDVNVVYYRLKQVDIDGKANYSNTLVVHVQVKGSNVKMQVSPNPFAESLNVMFSSTTGGVAELQIISVTGQKLLAQQINISKGYNTVQTQGLTKLVPGMYIAQLTMNGVMIDNQKIIKN